MQYINFKKWVFGEANILYIIGISGAGKTTIAQSIADLMRYEQGAPVMIINLDDIGNYIMGNISLEEVHPYLREHIEYYCTIQEGLTDWENYKLKMESGLVLEDLIHDLSHKYNNKRYIVEGMTIYLGGETAMTDWSNESFVIIKPKLIKSMYQAYARCKGKFKFNITYIYGLFKYCKKYWGKYLRDIYAMNIFVGENWG